MSVTPASCTVASRAVVPGLAGTVRVSTWPLMEDESQAGRPVSDQVHVDAEGLTVMVPLPPAAGSASVVLSRLMLQAPKLEPSVRRGRVMPLRASRTRAAPLKSREARVEAESVGKREASSATAPATCGVACEVPDIDQPAAETNTPGASNDTNEAELLKHATWSAADDASRQTEVDRPPPGAS